MFGKKAKLLRESNQNNLQLQLQTSLNSCLFSEFFSNEIELNDGYYCTRRKKLINVFEEIKGEDFDMETIKKIKEVFQSKKNNNKKSVIEIFKENNDTFISKQSCHNIQSTIKSVLNIKRNNATNIKTILPIEQKIIDMNKNKKLIERKKEDGKNITTTNNNFNVNLNITINIGSHSKCIYNSYTSDKKDNDKIQNDSCEKENEMQKNVANRNEEVDIEMINIEVPKKEKKQKISKPKIYSVEMLSQCNSISFEIKLSFPQVQIQLSNLLSSVESLKLKLNEKKSYFSSLIQRTQTLHSNNSKLLSHLFSLETHRKLLHDYIHKLKGNLRVYCRIKPALSSNEICISFSETSCQSLQLKNGTSTNFYAFDRCFPPTSTQSEIFTEIKQFVQSALDGENICVFAYGATGSGKTFTMQGTSEHIGILPRCAEFIFEEKNRLSKHNESINIFFAALEIYNENVFDLINKKKNSSLTIYSAGSEVNIPSLKWVEIQEKNDIVKYTNLASESRRCDSTSFNSTSSRSHAIFQIKIINEITKKQSMINIIDLAGSERSQISSFGMLNKEEIENMKKIQCEANYINKSLSALGRIINLIGDKRNNTKNIAIPYRESKLTVVLQNYLKPNAKTVMIVNIASELKNYTYTKESLNFAANAMVNC